MSHPIDKNIQEFWQDKHVKQVSGIPELVGRTGIVSESCFDEKGALHCYIHQEDGNKYFWCPAQKLEILG